MSRRPRNAPTYSTTTFLAALTAAVRGFAPYSWIELDSVELNGGTGKTENLVDKVTAGTGIRAIVADHKLVQATDAQRCAAPAASAVLNNQLAITFAGAQRYRSNATAADWKIHDGTGWELLTWYVGAAVSQLHPIIATAGATAVALTAHGVCIDAFNAASVETQELKIGNGTGTPVANNSAASGGAAGTAEYLNVRYIEAASPEWVNAFKTSTIGSGTGTPSANDPTIAIQVGADGLNANSCTGVWGGWLIWKRILTASERAVVRSYLATKFAAA